MTASVQSLWRYPVSSMGGERLDRADVDMGGIRGDRLWGVIAAASGEIASPKRPRWYPTPHVEARLVDGDAVEVRLSSGDWQPPDAAATQAALAAHFGFPVELLRHPRAHLPPAARTVEARYRIRPLHLVTSASLATLAEMLPDCTPDPRRFRPNLVVDWPDRSLPYPESTWGAGTELEVGGVRLQVLEQCRRCAFITVAQPGLAREPAILDAVARSNGADFGVLCAVLRPGAVAPGDPVRLAAG